MPPSGLHVVKSADAASRLPEHLRGREDARTSVTDPLDAARGFVVGMFLGLAVWLAVILLATIVMVTS